MPWVVALVGVRRVNTVAPGNDQSVPSQADGSVVATVENDWLAPALTKDTMGHSPRLAGSSLYHGINLILAFHSSRAGPFERGDNWGNLALSELLCGDPNVRRGDGVKQRLDRRDLASDQGSGIPEIRDRNYLKNLQRNILDRK